VKNNQVRIVVFLGVFAILGILSAQVYWLRKAYDVKARQFNESIHTALLNVAENVAADNDGNLSNENIINQLSNDYFVVNVNDIIDANTLEYYLSNEFQKLKINLDFEYAIYDCKNDEMVYGNYIELEEGNKKIEQTKNLPTYDEFDYYFGVYFPTKSGFVINNIKLSIFFSLILLVALVFFAYAIYVILNQKRLSELQTDFINNMTHEFKTPIASISLSSEAMLKNSVIKENSRLSNYTKIINEQATRLNGQVEKVLQIAQLQNNKLDLKKEEVDIVEIIENVIRSASLNYEMKNGEITFESEEEKIIILADKMHLTNILYNLLDNSLKYNQGKPIVNISCKKEKNHYLLEIKDNGIGIDKKYLNQLFQKFFRVPTGNVHDVKGFGIGLFYVKQVVDNHHWQIKIESELNKGTIVKICI